jgi:hypothetical protein
MPRVRKAELFDHLVGAQQDRCWNSDAQLRRRLEIQHELELGQRWSRLSEQIFRIDKWSLCRGQAAKRSGSGVK